MLLLPISIQYINRNSNQELDEQRKLAEFPPLEIDSIPSLPKKIEDYFNDHFGLRSTLFNWGVKIKYQIFNSSPKSEKVVIGKDGWLFLTGRFYEVTQDINRENLFSNDSLVRSVKIWEGRKKELFDLGINYYKSFWPDKYYIYPEMMPNAMQMANKTTLWRCDQAINYLDSINSAIKIIDVRQQLLTLKPFIPVHYKLDSHWNNFGAFIGYSELIKVICKDLKNIKPLSLQDFNIVWSPKSKGDLATILNVEGQDLEVTFNKKFSSNIEKMNADSFPKRTEIYLNHNNPNGPKALIYRDSYTNALIPFLMENFSEAVLIWDTPYSIEMVKRVKPNLVIECYASRYFK